MKMNFKRLGIVLFLLIAVAGFSMSSVCAGGEGDKVGEPNTLAIAFINTYHGSGVAVNGIQYERKMWVMMYAVHIKITELDENWTAIPNTGRDVIQGVSSDDLIEKFNPNAKHVKFEIRYVESQPYAMWVLPVDGSHYGGVCINSLGGFDNFRIVGNHYDTGWHKF